VRKERYRPGFATQLGRPVTPYRSALLLGSDHPDLGEIAVETISDDFAIGLSRGRFPKGYPHVDPNEDAAFAAADDSAVVFAVADGHNGFDAARAAMEGIADTTPQVLAAPATLAVERLLTVAIDRVGSAVPPLASPRNKSGAALTIGFARGGEMTTATLGDSGYALATKRRVRLNVGRARFLTPATDPTSVPIETVSLPSGSLIVAASDGVFDFASDALGTHLRSPVAGNAADIAADIIDLAGQAGAGDHLSVAVLRRD
jgi:serine/threonine protein phosphatase PrpC